MRKKGFLSSMLEAIVHAPNAWAREMFPITANCTAVSTTCSLLDRASASTRLAWGYR